jgi:hypothetical protein
LVILEQEIGFPDHQSYDLCDGRGEKGPGWWLCFENYLRLR